MKYSLWTDLSGEQSEFQDALDQLSYHQVLKINVFNLFDFSTMAHDMIINQKEMFAKSIHQTITDAKTKIDSLKDEITKRRKVTQQQRAILN